MPAPFRRTSFPPADMQLEAREDGVLLVRAVAELQAHETNLPALLEKRAAEIPDQDYLLQREAADGDWVSISYAAMHRDSSAAAQWLLDQNISAGRPLLILSGASILHATFKFGAMAAQVCLSPISPNYSTMGGDFGRLKHVIGLLRPAVVFAEHTRQFMAVLESLDFGDAIIVTREPQLLSRPAVSVAEVLEQPCTQAVAASIASIDIDSPCLYMLTSGSTSLPKAVIQTHRMIAANLAQGQQVLGRTAGWDNVMLDWMPWNHVSGSYTQLGVLFSGGTLYIDSGLPLPGAFERTIRNLREIPVRFFISTPAGFAMLVDALQADPSLREIFFSELRLALCGGAGLSQAVYDKFQTLAVKTIGKRIFFTTGYGATETTSGVMSIYFESEQVGIGLPLPGVTIKLVPHDDRYEIRMRGSMITPGYLGETPDSLFDDEGFLRIGDYAVFNRPGDISKGLRFAGRLAEQFKLASGTWVSGGALRAAVVDACQPLVRDALVCGLNREYISVLLWLNQSDIKAETAHTIATAIRAHNRENPGSSTRIRRIGFLDEPPSIDGLELSDKGTVNQTVALRRRAADVERLYAKTPDESIIVV